MAVQQITVEELAALAAAPITSGAAPRPLLLDAREPWEVEVARLEPPGLELLLVPMQEVPSRLAEIDTDRTVFVLCHHGMRSLQVTHYLAQRGVDRVVNVRGGIDAWSHQVDPAVPLY